MNYFDYAATTPLHPEAANVYLKLAQQCYGNTSSLHEIGAEAQNMLTYCRQQIAEMLNVNSTGIYFTSGGTESNLLSIISLAKANRHKGNHIITTAGEHPSVDSAMTYLQEEGFTVTVIPFTREGVVDLDLFQKALTAQTILASVQHINPEIGTIQPLEQIAAILRERNILLHSDCVQSFGKVDVKPVARLVDSLTISSHKIYGPKGVGMVYIHPRHRLIPVFPGLVNESGFRGGTVNVPGIAAFATAAGYANDSVEQSKSFRRLRDVFLKKVALHNKWFTVYQASHEARQLPHIIGLSVKNVEGQLIMLELNRRGFAISTGSACQVGQQQTSKAMMALQIDEQKAKGFIRISFGRDTTLENVNDLAECLIDITLRIQTLSVVN